MTITRGYAHGLPYDSYSLHALRSLASLDDVRLWAGRGRPPTTSRYRSNYGMDRRPPGQQIIGAVQHIAVAPEMRDPNRPDTSAESVTAWGLNPGNVGASWHDCTDRDSWVPYLGPDTRPWVQGITNPYGLDFNTLGWGQEMGIWDPNWNAKPAWFVEAHLRMSAAAWALVVAEFGIPLKLTLSHVQVLEQARRGESWGFTEHWVLDPGNRNDAGRWPLGGNRTTFPWTRLFELIHEELAIRAGAIPGTPGLPAAPSEKVRAIQDHLNAFGSHLDVDGLWGPLTEAAATQTAEDTAYPGDIHDHPALLSHLEDTMSKILQRLDDLDNTIRAQNDRLLRTKFPSIPDATLADILVGTNRVGHATRAAVLAQSAPDPAQLARDVADELRADLVAAVSEAGGGATADQIVDAYIARLTKEN